MVGTTRGARIRPRRRSDIVLHQEEELISEKRAAKA